MGLSVSQVFGTAFDMLRQRFLPLLGLWAIFFVLQIGATFVFGGATALSGLSGGDPEAIGAGMGLAGILFYLAYLLISLAQSASLTHQASPLHAPALGDSLSTGARASISLLGAYVLLGLATIAAIIPVFMVIGAAAMAGPAISVVLSLLLLPLLIWAACRLSMLVPVIATEGVGNPINAITRTWGMTKGHALQIFLVFLLFGIGAGALLAIIAAPMISAFMDAARSGLETPPDIGAVGVGTIVGLLLASLVFGLISPCIVAAIHAGLARHLDQDTPEVFS